MLEYKVPNEVQLSQGSPGLAANKLKIPPSQFAPTKCLIVCADELLRFRWCKCLFSEEKEVSAMFTAGGCQTLASLVKRQRPWRLLEQASSSRPSQPPTPPAGVCGWCVRRSRGVLWRVDLQSKLLWLLNSAADPVRRPSGCDEFLNYRHEGSSMAEVTGSSREPVIFSNHFAHTYDGEVSLWCHSLTSR